MGEPQVVMNGAKRSFQALWKSPGQKISPVCPRDGSSKLKMFTPDTSKRSSLHRLNRFPGASPIISPESNASSAEPHHFGSPSDESDDSLSPDFVTPKKRLTKSNILKNFSKVLTGPTPSQWNLSKTINSSSATDKTAPRSASKLQPPSLSPMSFPDIVECTTEETTEDIVDEEEEYILRRVEKMISQKGSSAMKRTDAIRSRLANMIDELQSMSPSTKGRQSPFSILRPTVSSDDASTDNDPSSGAPEKRSEIKRALERIRAKLDLTEKELSTERKDRKDRDDQMIKLAKKFRIAYMQNQEKEVKKKDLQRKLKTATSDLAQVQKDLVDHQSATEERRIEHIKMYTQALDKAKNAYSTACIAHEQKIQELAKSHADRCQDLRRKLASASQRAARFRNRVQKAHTQKKRAKLRPLATVFFSVVAVCMVCAFLTKLSGSVNRLETTTDVLLLTPTVQPSDALFLDPSSFDEIEITFYSPSFDENAYAHEPANIEMTPVPFPIPQPEQIDVEMPMALEEIGAPNHDESESGETCIDQKKVLGISTESNNDTSHDELLEMLENVSGNKFFKSLFNNISKQDRGGQFKGRINTWLENRKLAVEKSLARAKQKRQRLQSASPVNRFACLRLY